MTDQEDLESVRQHLAFGWWSLLVFLSLGIGLETLHGFKVAWYLDVGMETRRLMWRLAHAHGTFLSLVHIAMAATIYLLGAVSAETKLVDKEDTTVEPTPKRARRKNRKQNATGTATSGRWYHWASRGLYGASIGVPGGFFLGGVVVRGGDPGLGILVLPVAAFVLLFAVFLVARGVTFERR